MMATSSTALMEGEALLAAGMVNQNHDLFRCDAIDACIDRGRWGAAVDHPEALDDSARREPSPFSTFLVARGTRARRIRFIRRMTDPRSTVLKDRSTSKPALGTATAGPSATGSSTEVSTEVASLGRCRPCELRQPATTCRSASGRTCHWNDCITPLTDIARSHSSAQCMTMYELVVGHKQAVIGRVSSLFASPYHTGKRSPIALIWRRSL